MKQFTKNLTGGVVIILASAVIGVVHNAVRGQSITLIQEVKQVHTARHGNGGNGTTQSQTETSAAAELPEGAVTVEQVKALIDEGNVYIIDARAVEPFKQGHIRGAMNVPYDRLHEYYAELTATVPPDAKVVCYCWSPTCDFSDQLATELNIMGYTDVVVFTGGWEAWQEAGHPVEGSEVGE